MLPFEIMFSFPDREVKDAILTNYEYGGGDYSVHDDQDLNDEVDEDEELQIEEFKKDMQKSYWTQDEERTLLEYYEILKDDPTTLLKKLATVLNKYPEAIEEKLKSLGFLKPTKPKKDILLYSSSNIVFDCFFS